MHWLENALANVNLEALNDILAWTINTLCDFKLDIGWGESVFETTIPIASFNGPIFALAYLIIVLATCIKLWITIMSPFDTAEEPGAIALRFIGAGIGIAVSQELFKMVEGFFDIVYGKFNSVYTSAKSEYLSLPWNQGNTVIDELPEWQQNLYSNFITRIPVIGGLAENATEDIDEFLGNKGAFNLFGGSDLIQGEEAPSLGVLLLELIIGCTLLISFFRLMLEVYERYVLLGVMYFSAPLAFSSIISKDSKIFKSWMEMLLGQFILMCTNLVFLSGFMLAWYKIMKPAPEQGYVFVSANQYFTTMFCLIGWLIIGQKFDQHLKGLGLSTSQTGAGIMGALAGGAIIARTALGVAGAALGTIGGGARKAANGQLMEQRAMKNGDGLWSLGNGGLTGASKNDLNTKHSEPPLVPTDTSSIMNGKEKAEAAAFNNELYGATESAIASKPELVSAVGPEVTAWTAEAASSPVKNQDGSVTVSSNGVNATFYDNWNVAQAKNPGKLTDVSVGKSQAAAVRLEVVDKARANEAIAKNIKT